MSSCPYRDGHQGEVIQVPFMDERYAKCDFGVPLCLLLRCSHLRIRCVAQVSRVMFVLYRKSLHVGVGFSCFMSSLLWVVVYVFVRFSVY
jgi:hypothetical protein